MSKSFCTLHLLKLYPNPNPNSLSASTNSLGFKSCRNQQQQHQQLSTRREVLFALAFPGFTFPAIIPHSLAEMDKELGKQSSGALIGDNKKLKNQVWTATRLRRKNRELSYLSIRRVADYCALIGHSDDGEVRILLESFGKVEAFAETLIGGLDRSWQRPPGVAAKLVDCKAAKALGMAFSGWYNRLYTVTGQFVDDESEKYGSKIQKAVSSFKFI